MKILRDFLMVFLMFTVAAPVAMAILVTLIAWPVLGNFPEWVGYAWFVFAMAIISGVLVWVMNRSGG